MNKQVLILGVALLCALVADAGFAGGFSELPQERVQAYRPRLDLEFGNWKEKNHDFGYTLAHVKSGKSQTVAGTNYEFDVELNDAENKATPCKIRVNENLKGDIVGFKVECGAKLYTFKEL